MAAADFESFLPLPFPLEPPESFFDDESPDELDAVSVFDAESDLDDESVFVVESLPPPAESLPAVSPEELFPLPLEPFRESVL